MDSIMQRYELANFDDFSITGFLVPTGHYAQKIGLINLFKQHLKIKMKTVHHTPVEKIIELFISMIADCPDIKTLNNRLVPDKLAATAWCQKQFADQSRVSEVLHRITPENLLQLEEIFQTLFDEQSLTRHHPRNEWLIIDVGMTGLPVSSSSRTYEGATFGFMQKEKGKGYKLTCPYTGGRFSDILPTHKGWGIRRQFSVKMLLRKGANVREISQLIGRGLRTVKQYERIAFFYHPEFVFEKAKSN